MSIDVSKGERYNKLTVIKEVKAFVQPSGQTQRAFLCKCDCGNEKKVRLSHLRHDRVISCGCEIGEMHGDTGTNLHNIWRGMVNRCTRSSYKESHLYKDRGISVYNKWEKSYLTFKDWALNNGYTEGLTIDRIDNSKGYNPDNCRFVTQYINNLNRRNTFKVKYKGKKEPLMIILDRKGIKNKYPTIKSRIRRGWDAEEAIDKPIRKGNYNGGQTNG